MLRRHAVLVSDANEPRWNLGIWQVFDPWVDPHLLALQGYSVPRRTRPRIIEFHFRRVVQRLVRSLARLYQQAREWDHFLEAGGPAGSRPELASEIREEGGIAADSVFHYLNLFIDDLARIIPHILAADETDVEEPDGFSRLIKPKRNTPMRRMGDESKVPRLRELFTELDRDDSWWSQGFSYGSGLRQRLTHYTDLVYFHGSTNAGETRMSGDISLISIGGPTRVADFRGVADFEGSLQELFSKLCDWLDRLDQPLLQHLSAKLEAKGVSWDPINAECPAVLLARPEGVSPDTPPYLYLPLFGRNA